MDWDGVASDWEQVKNRFKQRWGKLTHDDLDHIAGRRELLLARLRAIYGLNKEHAEAQLRDWERHQEPIVFPDAGPRSGAPAAALAGSTARRPWAPPG